MFKFRALTRLVSKQQSVPFFGTRSILGASNFYFPCQQFWYSKNKFCDNQASQVLEVEQYIERANQHNQANKIHEALENYDRALKALTTIMNCQVPSYKDTLTMADIHIKKGSIFYLSANLDDALMSFQKAKDLLKECPGADLLIAQCLENIGSIHLELCEYEQAIMNLEKAIKIFKYHSNDLRLVKAYHGISIALDKLGKGEESLENIKKCLEMRIHMNGEEHEETANTYLILGEALLNQQKYQQALAAFKMALDIKINILGSIHMEISQCYSNLGQTHSLLGNAGEALASYTKSLKIKELNLGKNISLTNDYINIGDLYCSREDYVKALEYYKIAFKISNKSKIPNNNAYILYKLGSIYLHLGEINGAIKKFEKGLQAKTKPFLSEEGPNVSDFYEMLGLAYFNQEKYRQAEQYYSEALRICRKDHGDSSNEAIQLYVSLASTNCLYKNFESAMENYQKALKGQIVILGEDSPKLGYTYHGIGNVYYRQNQLDQAIECYNKAIDLLVSDLDQDNYYFATLHNDLGFIFKEQGKIQESIQNFEQAMTIAIQNYGVGHSEVRRLKNELKCLYDKQGDFEQVNKLERFLGL